MSYVNVIDIEDARKQCEENATKFESVKAMEQIRTFEMLRSIIEDMYAKVNQHWEDDRYTKAMDDALAIIEDHMLKYRLRCSIFTAKHADDPNT